MATLKIGKYLLNRIIEVGIREIFGVPGNYNSEFLDQVLEEKDLNWIGCTNELNAAYCVDGYTRINGIGALITTYGVGELSAANGIAGCYSEDVPIIHIVGTPKREYFKKHMILHHSLGTSDSFGAFQKIYQNITSFTVWLDAKNAINQIDNAIRYAVFYKKPVYIMLPADVASFEISCDIKPLSFASGFDVKEHQEILADIEKKINESHQAVIVSGHKILRYGLVADMNKFINNTNINVLTTPYGKGCVDETNDLFLGIYCGNSTYDQAIVKIIDTADLILIIGNKFTDLTSSFFQLNFDKNNVVEISDTHVKYDNKLFTNHSFGYLIKTLANKNIEYNGLCVVEKKVVPKFVGNPTKITYESLFLALNDFIKENDVIVSDMGSCSFMTQYLNLKKNTEFIMQPLWASSGFSFPASIGAKIASNKRIINIIGDGAFNMTFNELATVISRKLSIITILINNNGYTLEKVIHGSNQPYNQTAFVNYTKLISAFDENGLNSVSYKVNSEIELNQALIESAKIDDKFVFIEVCLDQFDTPPTLKDFFKELE